jgi:uncharacterized protein YfaS (alpha-2-macroglobulin family)
MKKKIIYYSAAAVALLVILFFVFRSCSKKPEQIDPGFSEYIAAFTSGRISANSTIRIEFLKDASGVELNAPIDENLFSFSPSIDGNAFWIDSRTVEFRPEKPLKQGQAYTAKFQLHKIFEVPKNLKVFKFDFETVVQSVAVTIIGYQPYIQTNLEWNNLTGKVLTADYADDQSIEEMVEAFQNKKKLKISWVHLGETREHQFTVDSVKRGTEASEVIIKWDGNKIGTDGSGEEKVKIPSIYDFYAIEARVEQEPNQFVAIRFSDPLDPKQDLNGLIHMGNSDFTFEINGVEVRAYPSSRQVGNAQIIIEQGVKNIAGAKLKQKQMFQIVFQSIKPAVRLTGKGVILPDSRGLILPFEAVNLRAVDLRVIKIFENNVAQFLQVNQLDNSYELKRVGRLVLKKTIRLDADKAIEYNKWNAFSIDLTGLVKQEPGAIYRVQLSFKKKYSTYPCEEGDDDKESIEMTSFQDRDREEFENEQSAWDHSGGYYYDYGGDYEDYEYEYNWEERDNPCDGSYYRGSSRSVVRNIIASNIGIIAKGNSNGMFTVAVSDILTAKPLSGVDLEFLNYQKQVIATGKTDNDGFCSVTTNRVPYLIIAKNGEQRGYLRVDDGSALSLSNFDVSGEVVQKGLKGFIYGERGVWRPGDTIFLTFILEDKLKKIPANHPVILEIINPQGKVYKKITKTSGENGFYLYTIKTSDSDLTGNYQANIRVGTNTYSKTLKVETVKPNRLKILFDFGTETITSDNQSATINVKWLHGAVAKNMKTDIKVTLSSTSTTFKGFEKYNFDDPTKKFETEEQEVFDGNVDESGQANIDAGIQVSGAAPGMLRANFVTRVYEPGGDFSIDKYTVNYSPYTSYVGLSCPEGIYNWLFTDTAHVFNIATVNSNGKPVNRQNLEFRIYKVEWRWWWNSNDDDLADYMSDTYRTPVFSTKVNTVNGKAKVTYRLNYPNWGRYLVRVVDTQSGHSTGNTVYFDWPFWRGRADRGDATGATMLTFSSDKKSYKVGDKATISVPSSENSRLLVSLETGSEVLKAWWVNAEPKETRVSFDITDKMAPNVYVSVSLVQPHAQVKNDLPLRLYGVIPLLVDNPDSRLEPVIDMPDVLIPEQDAVIKISEKNKKAMTYTLALVDEGLLDLTRFKTPDPWTAFNGREALGIKTWDLYDLVMGAFGGKIEQLFSIGGDDEGGKKDGAKAQRFKPVVKVLGPFTLNSGSKTHKIKMPQYVGSVRVMVIAGNNGAFGKTDKTVPVRKPLMVLATLPRVLGPGEEVDLPVTVFAMEKSIKNFKVEVSTNEMFQVIDSRSQTVAVDEPGESDISFRLKVLPVTGIGKVKVVAQSGYEKSEYDIEIDVRNPNPRIVKYFEAVLEGGKSADLNYELIGVGGTNKAELEVSSIPPVDLGRRMHYLLTYPYGCVEQTTSGAFPQLYLDKFYEFKPEDKSRRDENMVAAIKRISSMVAPDGGIGYWPGDDVSNAWGTCYAGHYMIEAEKKGYMLPPGFMSGWVKYQKRMARNWNEKSDKEYYYWMDSELIQAYRLYTLALSGNAEMGAMNRLKEKKGLSVAAAWRLAAAYALAGQPAVAKQILNTAGSEIKDYQKFNATFGCAERDWAMMLETLCLLKDKTTAFGWMKKVANVLSSNYWLSTQTTAYSLIGISKFIEISDATGDFQFTYTAQGKSAVRVGTKLPVAKIKLDSRTLGNYTVKIDNTSKGMIYARVVTEGIPATGPETGFENNLKMTVVFKSSNGTAIDVSSLSQGTDFEVEVTVRNSYASMNMTNVALSQVFPSGWEISNTRFLQDGITEESVSDFTYQDFRDDRVNTFFDLPAGYQKKFIVKLTATYAGKFYLPGTLCEAMYEPGVNAFVPGKWVEVVK